MIKISFILSLYYVLTLTQTDRAKEDEVVKLPGVPSEFKQRHFAGYIDISPSKHIFYWFMESSNNPDTDPLFLWTNGGPGCSGMVGFMTEMGPFRPTKGSPNLMYNNNNWNKFANIVYIEQPVGVGFSQSDDPSIQYNEGDTFATDDNYTFILEFFKRFPDLKKNEFWLTSESYGGHYLPLLAKKIAEMNSTSTTKIELKGFLDGNPYTNAVENAIGMYDTLWGHQLVSKGTYLQYKVACNDGKVFPNSNDACNIAANKMLQEANYNKLDPYGLDFHSCPSGGPLKRVEDFFFLYKTNKSAFNYYSSGYMPTQIIDLSVPRFYPCLGDYTSAYLNREDVQTALHVKNIKWKPCNNIVNQYWTGHYDDMVPIHDWINKNTNQKVLIFSGDDDSVCGLQGTQSWIWGIGGKVKTEWQTWNYESYNDGKQIGGYIVEFEGNQTLATVHGAGHMTPYYKPLKAYNLIYNYIKKQ